MTTRGKAFEPGQSGNPSEKPKGTRHRTTLAMDALLEGEAETLARKAIELALDLRGPPRACTEGPSRPVRPAGDRDPADLPKATHALLQAIAACELTPSEAADIGKAVDAHVRLDCSKIRKDF